MGRKMRLFERLGEEEGACRRNDRAMIYSAGLSAANANGQPDFGAMGGMRA